MFLLLTHNAEAERGKLPRRRKESSSPLIHATWFYLLSHINFPKISLRYYNLTSDIITEPTTVKNVPVIFARNKCCVVVHPSLSFFAVVSPLPNMAWAVISPLMTLHGQLRVIAIQSFIRITWGGKHVRLTAEVLDYSFTSAVSDRGHVERTYKLFIAVESQLSEGQMCS